MAERKCPRCGADLAADAPEGLCPQCLLQVGIQTQSQPPTTSEAGFTPPRIAELNDLFPQLEFLDLLGTGVRVTSIDPGLVETEFSIVRFHGDAARAASVYRDLTPLTAADVAESVLYAITRPDRVSVAEITLYPTDQASARDVNRKPRP